MYSVMVASASQGTDMDKTTQLSSWPL